MPENQFITGIPGIQTQRVERGQVIKIFGVAEAGPETQCPRCGSKRMRIKASQYREFRHGLWGQRLVVLAIKIPKYVCKECGRYFVLRLPGVLPKRRSTEQFRRDVFQLQQGGFTQVGVSRTHGISQSTAERWYHDFIEYRVKELAGRDCPIVLGIDEHFFSRREGFATSLIDLKNHKVFDVVLGRTEQSLGAYLKRLKGRERVQVVVMDLSETYRSIVRKYFPNAMIVADRFHVVRLWNQQFLKTWNIVDPEGRKNRGLLSLMRRHEQNLSSEQVIKLRTYLESKPGLEPLYRFKQDLMQLFLIKKQKRSEAKQLIPKLLWHLNELLESHWEPLQTFGKTLKSWLEPIVRMWRFSKNNGITEGFHTKMEMISRRAFGFRNFKNYRLRVIALCGWNGVLATRN